MASPEDVAHHARLLDLRDATDKLEYWHYKWMHTSIHDPEQPAVKRKKDEAVEQYVRAYKAAFPTHIVF